MKALSFIIFLLLSTSSFAFSKKLCLKKIQRGLPSWGIEQIRKDLLPFHEKGVTKEQIDQLMKADPIDCLLRCQIKNRKIQFSKNRSLDSDLRAETVSKALTLLNRMIALPDLDFVVCLEDFITRRNGKIPCFAFAKDKQQVGAILIPDFEALAGYDDLVDEILKLNGKFPWKKKKTKAFWRGATTGGALTARNWRDFPRCQLALLSLDRPRLLDAKFTSVVQAEPQVPSILEREGLLGSMASKEKHLEYKYLLDVDGNSCTYSRYYWELLSSSVVFKHASQNIQWYYRGLIPYVHYIPIAADFSDLFEQINWAILNDAAAQKIARQASRFIQENLLKEDIYCYLYYALIEYAKVQNF